MPSPRPPETPGRSAALLLLQGQATCYTLDKPADAWQRLKLGGQEWLPLQTHSLPRLLEALHTRTNLSQRLSDYTLHLIADANAQPWLAQNHVGAELAKYHCRHWQVLMWQPLSQRARWQAGASPEALPESPWLQEHLLPMLQTIFASRGRLPNAAPPTQPSIPPNDTLESLKAERQRLRAELAELQEQIASDANALITQLPALYRNAFGVISPHDLALLAGNASRVPKIPSPYPEPSPDTLRVLQKRVRNLPPEQARDLRQFCLQLPHPLEPRPEMRAWLEQDE